MHLMNEVDKIKNEEYSEANAEAKLCQDIIISAISKSSLNRNVTIKGGVVMRSLSGEVRRATHTCLENEHDRVQNLNPNKNNINKTNMSNTILSINHNQDAIDEMEGYSQIIKENIDYDSLLLAHPYDHEMVEGIFELILETVLSKNDEITIAGGVYPNNFVKSKFLKLNYSHVEYVIACLGKNTTKVRNIKSYLLASLFNAGSTISSYYRAEVNHDMPQYARTN